MSDISIIFRGEYFLADYMTKIGNFDFEYLRSGMHTEGYFYDNYFDDGDEIVKNYLAKQPVLTRNHCSTKSGDKSIQGFYNATSSKLVEEILKSLLKTLYFETV